LQFRSGWRCFQGVPPNAGNDSSAVFDATSNRIGGFVERPHQLVAILFVLWGS
jgi:hypothetical protein